MVLKNILALTLGKERMKTGKAEAYEVGIATEEGIPLPCGAGGMYVNDGR